MSAGVRSLPAGIAILPDVHTNSVLGLVQHLGDGNVTAELGPVGLIDLGPLAAVFQDQNDLNGGNIALTAVVDSELINSSRAGAALAQIQIQVSSFASGCAEGEVSRQIVINEITQGLPVGSAVRPPGKLGVAVCGCSVATASANNSAGQVDLLLYGLSGSNSGLLGGFLSRLSGSNGGLGGLYGRIGGIGGSGLSLDIGIQNTTGVELDLAFVIGQAAGNGDGIANSDHISALTLQAEALDGLDLTALNNDGNSNIVVLRAEGNVDLGDNTGQGLAINVATDGQLVSVVNQLLHGHTLGGILGSFANGVGVQSTALIKLDGAVVVLDGTGNGDGITNLDHISALALHTVAHNGLVIAAFNSNGNRYVVVTGVIGSIDSGDNASQSLGAIHHCAVSQLVCSINDLLHSHTGCGLGRSCGRLFSGSLSGLCGSNCRLGGSYSRLSRSNSGLSCGSGGLGLNSTSLCIEASWELSNINVTFVHIAQLGCAQSGVGNTGAAAGVSTQIVRSTANVCNEGVKGIIPGVYSGGSIGQAGIYIRAILIDINVGLSLACHEIHPVTASYSLDINVDALSHSGRSGQVVVLIGSGADKGQNALDIAGIHGPLVCNANAGLADQLVGRSAGSGLSGLCCGSSSAGSRGLGCGSSNAGSSGLSCRSRGLSGNNRDFLHSCQVSNKVGDIHSIGLIAGNIGNLGSTEGAVGAISTEVEIGDLAVDVQIASEGLDISIPLQDLGGSGGEDNIVMGSRAGHLNVVLLAAILEVQTITAGNLLNVDINCLLVRLGGSKVEAIHLAGQVQSLAQVLLSQEELVCLAGLGLSNDLRYQNTAGRRSGLSCGSGGLSGRRILALDVGIQSAALIELDSAVVVLQNTGDSDGIADIDLVSTLACQTVALDGLVLTASNLNGNGNIAVSVAVGSVNAGDDTGQSMVLQQHAAGSQIISGINDLLHGHFGLVIVIIAGAGDVLNDPAVLDLCSAVVLTQRAVNGDGVASHGLNFHLIVAHSAVSIVGAVDGQDITLLVSNVHIAVLGVVNLEDLTGNLVLDGGVLIQLGAEDQSLLDGDGCAIGGGQFGNILTGLSRNLIIPGGSIGLAIAGDGSSQLEVDSLIAAGDLNGNSAVAVVNDLDSGVIGGPLDLNLLTLNSVVSSAGKALGNSGGVGGAGIISTQLFKCLLLFADLGLLQGSQVCNEVGLIQSLSVLSGNAGYVGAAHGLVGAVCTEVVITLLTVDLQIAGEGLDSVVPLQDLGGLGGENDVIVILAGGFRILSDDLQVVLNAALQEVQAVTAGNLLHIDINSLSMIRGGSVVEAVHFAGQVQVLAQSLLVQEELVGSAGLGCSDDLGDHGGGGNVLVCGRNIRAGILPADQSRALSKLNGAVVVHQITVNGDGVVNADLVSAITSQTVALDGLAIDLHHDGNVLVTGVIRSLDLGNNAGQSCLVGQSFAIIHGKGILKDLIRIGGGLDLSTGLLDLDQLAACIELDRTLIVYDVALDGDGIADQQVVCAFTDNAVAQDGVLGITGYLNGNGNVIVRRIIGRVDLGDLTGQSSNVLQAGIGLQSISILQDLLHIRRSFNGLTLNNSVQNTAGIKLDRAVIVLQNTGNGNGVADLQVLSAVALQAVALDGLTLSTGNHDGYGDVLVVLAPGGVDSGDHTGQSNLIVHRSADFQLIGFLDDGCHIVIDHRQQVIPAIGNTFAVGVGNGSGQNVRNILSRLLIDVNGNHTIFALDDLNVLLAYVNGPNDLVVLSIDRNYADTLEIPRRFLAGILVDRLDIGKCSLQVGLSRNIAGRRRFTGTLGEMHQGTNANAQQQCHDQGPDNYLLLIHSLLL